MSTVWEEELSWGRPSDSIQHQNWIYKRKRNIVPIFSQGYMWRKATKRNFNNLKMANQHLKTISRSKSTPEDEELNIDDRSLEIGAVKSNELYPTDFASSHVDPPGDVIKPDIDLPDDFNMVDEQQKDSELRQLKNRTNKGTAPRLNKIITLRRKMGSCIVCLSRTPRIQNFDFTFLKKWETSQKQGYYKQK